MRKLLLMFVLLFSIVQAQYNEGFSRSRQAIENDCSQFHNASVVNGHVQPDSIAVVSEGWFITPAAVDTTMLYFRWSGNNWGTKFKVYISDDPKSSTTLPQGVFSANTQIQNPFLYNVDSVRAPAGKHVILAMERRNRFYVRLDSVWSRGLFDCAFDIGRGNQTISDVRNTKTDELIHIKYYSLDAKELGIFKPGSVVLPIPLLCIFEPIYRTPEGYVYSGERKLILLR